MIGVIDVLKTSKCEVFIVEYHNYLISLLSPNTCLFANKQNNRLILHIYNRIMFVLVNVKDYWCMFSTADYVQSFY